MKRETFSTKAGRIYSKECRGEVILNWITALLSAPPAPTGRTDKGRHVRSLGGIGTIFS